MAVNPNQFAVDYSQVYQHLGVGDEADPDSGQAYELGNVPPSVFRVMSDEEYRSGVQAGRFRSDGRNNWRAQAVQEGRSPEGIPEEGTVAGVYAELGYLPHHAPGRVVRFRTADHPGWEVHPHVSEGDYIRTMGEIPASSVEAVSPRISRSKDPNRYYIHRS